MPAAVSSQTKTKKGLQPPGYVRSSQYILLKDGLDEYITFSMSGKKF